MADNKVFSGEEIWLIERLIKKHWGKTAKQMSRLTHGFLGYKLAKIGETIPYNVALVGWRAPTVEEQKYGIKLELDAAQALA